MYVASRYVCMSNFSITAESLKNMDSLSPKEETYEEIFKNVFLIRGPRGPDFDSNVAKLKLNLAPMSDVRRRGKSGVQVCTPIGHCSLTRTVKQEVVNLNW